MLTWIDPPETPLPPGFRETVGGHPLVAELLARRGLRDVEAALAFMDPARYQPAPPEDLPGMDLACRRIEQAAAERQSVWVWGDFDVDGQTSTALLVSTLRSLGIPPNYHIPVRARESHGVNSTHLASILDAGAQLVITCDTGITSYEALALAQSRGVDVIVTDHHLLGQELPSAMACITPRLLPANHPFSGLPGVGVAFQLALALLRRAGRAGEADDLLDLVALGIVADVAQQTADTRYLLQRGLVALRRTRRPGLQAIMELAEVNPANLSEEHIGFAIGPRLNALGRLDDANPAVELLTTNDAERARVLALQLESLNARRQLLTSQVVQAAIAQVDRDPTLLDSPVLVLDNPNWPVGVIGIAASALVERYRRPAILLASPPGRPAHGSARSVDGVDITACIAQSSRLLLSFGGHPMAAGLALEAEQLPAFRRAVAQAAGAQIQAAGGLPEQALQIDGQLGLTDLTLDLVNDFERLAPFGAGNPAPVFMIRDLGVSSGAVIGRGREHRMLTLEDRAANAQKVLWWGGAAWPQPEGRFDLACSLRASDFRGQREVQVEWVDSRPIPEETLHIDEPALQVIDHRGVAHPRAVLEALRAESGLVIWAEGEAREKLSASDRSGLSPAAHLAIWTTPPGRQELAAALSAVKPEVVLLFAIDPETNDPPGFLNRLTGLVKYLLGAAAGEPAPVDLARLAAATAQREAAVRCGLHWLAARGFIRLDLLQDGGLALSPGSGKPTPDDAEWMNRLRNILDETAAYRRFFAVTEPALLNLTQP